MPRPVHSGRALAFVKRPPADQIWFRDLDDGQRFEAPDIALSIDEE
jgi:hypothetical protein